MRTTSRIPKLGATEETPIVTDAEYKIFLVNDMHFREGTDGNPLAEGATNGLDRYYYASPNLLRNFVEIVNNEKPDFVMALGDMCDIPSDWNLFNKIWNSIDDLIPRGVTIGNHDLDVQSFDDILTILRYDGKKENAGSKFNQTYVINKKGFAIRIIVIDATFNNSDLHGSHYDAVRVHSDAVSWMGNILNTCKEDYVFICSHVGVHESHFNPDQRTQIKNLVDGILLNKPNLKVTWLFGHHHVLELTPYTNLGDRHLGYLLPALILNESGRFTELTISPNGYTLNKRDLVY